MIPNSFPHISNPVNLRCTTSAVFFWTIYSNIAWFVAGSICHSTYPKPSPETSHFQSEFLEAPWWLAGNESTNFWCLLSVVSPMTLIQQIFIEWLSIFSTNNWVTILLSAKPSGIVLDAEDVAGNKDREALHSWSSHCSWEWQTRSNKLYIQSQVVASALMTWKAGQGQKPF